MRRRAAIFSFLVFAALAWAPSWSAAESEQDLMPSGYGDEIPYKHGESVDGLGIIKSFIVLIVLLGSVAGVTFLFRKTDFAKKLGVSESRYIELIELRRLSPKLAVYLIKVNEKYYLLAQTGEAISLVEHSGNMKQEL